VRGVLLKRVTKPVVESPGDEHTPPTEEDRYAAMVMATLASYIQDAASYAAGAGKDDALAAFGDPLGEYIHDGWYIYAYDNECILLAHPYEPGSLGLNRSGWTDSRGLPVIRMPRDVALPGAG